MECIPESSVSGLVRPDWWRSYHAVLDWRRWEVPHFYSKSGGSSLRRSALAAALSLVIRQVPQLNLHAAREGVRCPILATSSVAGGRPHSLPTLFCDLESCGHDPIIVPQA